MYYMEAEDRLNSSDVILDSIFYPLGNRWGSLSLYLWTQIPGFSIGAWWRGHGETLLQAALQPQLLIPWEIG